MPFLDDYVRQSQASPSVSLEKGAYRLRASKRNASKPTPLRARADSRASPRDSPLARHEKQLAVLVVLLICAMVACFGTAYYLFTTRWEPDLRPVSRAPPSNIASRIQVIDFEVLATLPKFQPPNNLPLLDDKYLAYSPHSGFHNQRIAFENALVLSRLLNRTLLVPPVRLGNAFLHYAPFDALPELLVQSDKRNLQHCKSIYREDDAPEDCADYSGYMHVPWDWLVDLSGIQQHQKLASRDNFTEQWFYATLGLDDEDIFSLADTFRDMYGFQDFDPLSAGHGAGRKYQHIVHLSTLALREERLIHLGTLFGSSRLHLRNPQNLAIRKFIRQEMARLNPLFVGAADAVQRTLGGRYIGAHIRLGDGTFQENAFRNSRLVWWKLTHGVLGFSVQQTLDIERRFADIGFFETLEAPEGISGDWNQPDSASSLYQVSGQPDQSPLVSCKGLLHLSSSLRVLNTPLFISSDAEEPRDNPYLQLFLRTFPCAFFLTDFSHNTTSLDDLQNSVDGLLLKPFLLPFVDALVVSRGERVVGTEGSTYSRFVESVLWRTYHGREIA